MRAIRRSSLVIVSAVLAQCTLFLPLDLVVVTDFADGAQGWSGGFSDYPVASAGDHQLQCELRPLPDYLGGDTAMYVSGNNPHDDLFMFLKARTTGLEANHCYRIVFRLRIASCYPAGSSGIGGSPAESVYLKVGATTVEPLVIEDGDSYLMNVDKGRQNENGPAALVIGDIAKPGGEEATYQIVSRDNAGAPFEVTTDESGSLWLLVGTDSGFEGTTSIYYEWIRVEFYDAGPAAPA